MIKYVNVGFMQTTCVNSKDNSKSYDSDHIFVIRENTRLKHRCPYFLAYRIRESEVFAWDRNYFLAYPTRISAIFTRSGYFRLIQRGVRRPRA